MINDAATVNYRLAGDNVKLKPKMTSFAKKNIFGKLFEAKDERFC